MRGRRTAMADWRDAGKDIELELRKPLLSEKQHNAIMNSFVMACGRWYGSERNPKPLLEWLRSDKPFDRNELADAIERAKLLPPSPSGRGRPRNRINHEVAAAAEYILGRWQRLNKERGIADYRHRSKMEDIAIEMAGELEGHNVDLNAVRKLLDR
jgi:hypothetical protein